jgi:predicted transcriptional regulator
MSNDILNYVFELPVHGAKKSILVALADRANRNWECWPAIEDIATRSGCSVRHAFRVIKELEQDGFFTITRKCGRPNKYTFTTANVATPTKSEPRKVIFIRRN